MRHEMIKEILKEIGVNPTEEDGMNFYEEEDVFMACSYFYGLGIQHTKFGKPKTSDEDLKEIAKGSLLDAIKIYRNENDCSLTESRDYIYELMGKEV